MTDCHITEYDGAFICWTHNRTWGAVPEPDEPCKGAWTPKPHDKCFSDCGCESSAYEQRIAALEAELAAARKELNDWKTFTYCVYCGHKEHVDNLGEAITNHIMTCEKHPIHAAAKQLADRDRTIAELRVQVAELKAIAKSIRFDNSTSTSNLKQRIAAALKE